MEIRKEKTWVKNVCLVFLVTGFIYGIILPFCWHNDPMDPLGTLSHLCENRKIWFWLWTLLSGGGLFLNLQYMYRKYGGANRLIRLLPAAALLSVIVIALTLGHSIADWNPKRVAHWIATGAYVAFLGLSVVIYALANIRKGKIFRLLLISSLAILALFLGWFIIIGKNGLLEIIPNLLIQIVLFFVNFIIDKPKRK